MIQLYMGHPHWFMATYPTYSVTIPGMNIPGAKAHQERRDTFGAPGRRDWDKLEPGAASSSRRRDLAGQCLGHKKNLLVLPLFYVIYH